MQSETQEPQTQEFKPEETIQFLTSLDSSPDEFTFVVLKEKDRDYSNTLVRFDLKRGKTELHGSFEQHREYLEQANRLKLAIYIVVNETDGEGKKIENIIRVRALCQEDDDGFQGDFPIEPTMVVQSSPGKFHRYFVVNSDWPNDKTGRLEFERCMGRLVRDYGSDRYAKAITGLRRLPGFYHHKGKPFLVSLTTRSDNTYTREELVTAFPSVETDAEPVLTHNHLLDDAEPFDGEDERLLSALDSIPACDRGDWLKVGLALHHESNGDIEGAKLWDWWSQKSPEKFKGRDDIIHHWNGFRGDHDNPVTIASVYKLARSYGWNDELQTKSAPVSVKASDEISKNGDLTTETMRALRNTFDSRNHRPSLAQWVAIEDLVNHLESAANGTLKPLVYVSPLDPGVGKTETAKHFLKALLGSPSHKHVAAVYFVSRISEVKTLAKELELRQDQYATLVYDNEENREINFLGNPNPKDARVLFTTQQMLESRGKPLQSYRKIYDFKFKGEHRRVVIWDEAILPIRPVTVNLTALEGMTQVLEANHQPLCEMVRVLISDVKTASNNGFVDVPDFDDLYGVSQEDVAHMFDGESDQRKKDALDLWHLGGKTVVVRRDRSNTILDYETTLFDDVKPLVVLDASARVRHTYTHWSNGRGDVVILNSAEKDYTPLDVHIWERGGSKQSWKDNNKELLEGIVKTILKKPNEDWLVIHHKKGRNFNFDIPKMIRDRLPHAVAQLIVFHHWGDHTAFNDCRDISNVMLAGTLFYPNSYHEALARGTKGIQSNERVSKEDLRQMERGEYAHLILQALCRGSVRKSDGSKCSPCEAYIIASPNSGIPAMLKEGYIFPGCTTTQWHPICKELTGRKADALSAILGLGSHKNEIKAADVYRSMSMKKDDFNSDVLDSSFERKLIESGYHLERRKGRGGTVIIKQPW